MAGEPKVNRRNTIAKKGGRPEGSGKFDEKITANIELIKKYYRFGMTDKQVAELIGIGESTLKLYKKNESFLAILKNEKQIADTEVIASLYKRATGYEYDEIYQEGSPDGKSSEIKIKTIKKTRKHIAPDTTAIIYWLRNRQRWIDKLAEEFDNEKESLPEFDNMTDEQLKQIING